MVNSPVSFGVSGRCESGLQKAINGGIESSVDYVCLANWGSERLLPDPSNLFVGPKFGFAVSSTETFGGLDDARRPFSQP